MNRPSYPSDLSDTEWGILAPLIPVPKAGGRPRTTDMREVLNAIFYVNKGGIQWRMLPHEFPRWKRCTTTIIHGVKLDYGDSGMRCCESASAKGQGEKQH